MVIGEHTQAQPVWVIVSFINRICSIWYCCQSSDFSSQRMGGLIKVMRGQADEMAQSGDSGKLENMYHS